MIKTDFNFGSENFDSINFDFDFKIFFKIDHAWLWHLQVKVKVTQWELHNYSCSESYSWIVIVAARVFASVNGA